tara:strand:+ start:3944 stop:4048 length:105 start_codon:yes stop_codon:yes gene_type:complete
MKELLKQIRIAQINRDETTEVKLLKQLDEMERLL